MCVPRAVCFVVDLKGSHPQRRLPLRHCADDRSSVRLLASLECSLSHVYSPFYATVFPENMLKNIAISTVFTTHFVMIESTMLPSCACFSLK